ncbi:MAG TPA: PAS domain S-box protein, partial [Myxococcota bacterium]|nr:PAS domain S-box protein [Myxococcota bacterium]
EAKFAAAFYGSADAILISRASDGVFFEANDAAVKLSGHSREKLLGKSAVDLATWEDPARREELQRRLPIERRVFDFEARLFTAQGDLRDAVLHASLIDIDGELCQLTVVKDVTAARQADRAMRDSEQRLRAVFESVVDALVVIDERGLIEAINPACERIFGYRAAELIGQSVGRLMPEEQRDAHEHHVERRRRGAQSHVMGLERELVAQRRDGSRFPVEIILAEIQDSRGRRFSATIRDISRRKEAESAATHLNQELAASVAALERLNRDNATLSELRDLLQTCQTVDEVVRISTQFSKRLLTETVGALYLFDTSRGLLEESARWGEGLGSEPVFTRDDCWALRRGRTFEVTPRDGGVCCDHVRGPAALPYACVPLTAQGETLGILHVQVQSPAHDGASALNRRVPTALAEYLSLAIVNVRMRETLRRQATRDPLTQLFNRRYMEEVFERELRRAERHGRELGVVLLDIDHFKRINDTLGHHVGDHVLTEVALILQRSVRGEDFVFRYGGEEFLLLLPDAAAASLGARTAEIAERVRETAFAWGGKNLESVRISAGVASYPAHGGSTG